MVFRVKRNGLQKSFIMKHKGAMEPLVRQRESLGVSEGRQAFAIG